MRLELVIVPVADVDASLACYRDGLGFPEDHDARPAEGVRVQLTPPGSACSVSFGTGLPVSTESPPGSVKGLHLVVADLHAARAELAGRGFDVGEVQDVGGGGVRYAGLRDPDGDTLVLQEPAWRTGDRW